MKKYIAMLLVTMILTCAVPGVLAEGLTEDTAPVETVIETPAQPAEEQPAAAEVLPPAEDEAPPGRPPRN